MSGCERCGEERPSVRLQHCPFCGQDYSEPIKPGTERAQTLIPGSLYLVRWKLAPASPEEIALYCSNEAKCDPDETPSNYLTFFGDGLDEYNLDNWEILTRLDVVPIAHDHPNARTWRDDV